MGGKEARAVRLMNAFDDAAHHTVLSAVPGALGARWALWPEIVARFPGEGEAPALAGRPGLARYWRLARYMADFDLVLSYNWGAMDGVMAHRLYGRMLGLPPLVHHEDGFNADELDRQKRTRMLFRHAALGTAYRVVVPSARLERIARTDWGCPPARITRIANGVPLERYAGQPAPDSIPGFRRASGDVVVGTMAGLRSVKNLPRLVRAFARAGGRGRLVIAGEGPEREVILAVAQAEGLGDRVLLPGFLPDPARYVGHFDIFALSSDSEQFPISLVEAMAAGLPVVSTDVGDIATMVAPENRRYVVAVTDEDGFAEAIGRLIGSRDLRHRLGSANRTVAWARYGEDSMIAAYRALYEEAMGRPGGLS
ncbi:MAG TPA: glycosyltransferase family 4 protein [Sphingomonas sp.]|nr:glycosyltransferase family 4 protein [Sphingomonas sp.]